MSKYSLRRVLSFLLAVMMVCTLLPTAAFAEEGVEQPTAGEQTAATPDGEIVPEVQNEPAEESLNLTGAPVVLDAPQPNSTVLLYPSDGYMPTGVKVAVGDKINGYTVSKIDGKVITVDLGKYNVNNDSFRLPLPEDIWVGVKMQYGTNQTYVSWAGSGSSRKTPGDSALLANGTNTAYYYRRAKDDGTSANVWNFTLKYDANGGTGAPADQTYGTADKYEKSHSFTIPTGVPTRDGFVFKGWSDTKGGTAAYQPGGTCHVVQTADGYNGGSVTKTLYAVWEAEGPSKPQKPSDVFLQNLGNSPVRLSCTTNSISHNYYRSNMLSGSYEPGDVTEVNGIYICTVTVYAQKYVDAYNKHNTVQHELDDVPSKSFTLTYNAENKTWEVPDGNLPIRFSMKCPPQQPTIDTIKARNWKVGITCVDKKDTHFINNLFLSEGDFTVGEMKQDEDGSYICEITVKAEKYIEEFYKSYYVSHTFHKLVDGEPSEKTFTARFVSGNWVADEPVVTFKVTCDFMPEKPDIETLLSAEAVGIDCVTEGSNHKRERFPLIDGSYTVTDPERDDNGTRVCFVTVDSAPYLAEYAKSNGDHKPASAEESKKTYRVWFNATSGEWDITLPGYSFIRFAAVCDNTPTPPEKPENPNVPEVLKDFKVTVNCSNAVAGHGSKNYALMEGSYTCSEPSLDSNSEVYSCSVTINPAKYVEQFTKDKGNVQHTLSGESSSVTLTLEYTDEAWTLSADSPTSAAFTVECETVYYSYKVVHVYRTNGKEDGRTDPATYPSVASGTVVSADSITKETTYNGNTYEYANADPEQAAISNNDVVFTLYYGRIVEMCTVTYTDGVDGKVFPNQEYTVAMGEATPGFNGIPTREGYKFTGWDPAVSATVTETTVYTATWEPEVPKKPTEEEVEKLFDSEKFIQVRCSFRDTHTGWVACKLEEGNYEIGSVTKKGDDYYCTIELDAASYADQYNAISYTGSHRLSPADQKHTLTLKFDRESETWTAVDTRTIKITVSCARTVTYTDGVDGEEIFADQEYTVGYGDATPAFNGTPTRKDYVFAGWNPAVADKVTEDVTYTATWKEDLNNNGKPDDEEERFTVTYTDGVKGKAFKDQVYDNLLPGTDTPEFSGKPTRKGYTFAGWTPKVADTVTKDVTYTATWKAVNTSGKDKLAKTGDNGLVLVFGGLMLLSLCGAAAVCVIDRKRRHS